MKYDYFKIEGDTVDFFEKGYEFPVATLTLAEVFEKAGYNKN